VQFARRHIGSVLEVLVESPRDRGRGTLGGVAQNYLRIVMRGEEEDIGRLVHVRAEGMEGERLIGRIVEADPGKKDHSASI
jgi:tRNA A37 methylthiotransferase MiaB